MKGNFISTLVFDRSNPERVYTVGKDGKKTTILESLQAGDTWLRADIGMINFHGYNGNVVTQECIYADARGVVWNGFKDYFSPEEIRELQNIAIQLKSDAKKHPEMSVFLKGY